MGYNPIYSKYYATANQPLSRDASQEMLNGSVFSAVLDTNTTGNLYGSASEKIP